MQQNGNFHYAETEDLQLLELPYKGDDISMVILLPKQAKGLPKLEDELTEENLRQWLSAMSKQR